MAAPRTGRPLLVASEAMARGRTPVRAYVGLGANLGQARQTLAWAVHRLAALPDVANPVWSGLFASAPWQAEGPDYFNAVLGMDVRYTAPELWRHLAALEYEAGRRRPYRHAPRSLDLDLLFYGTAAIASATLTVPHPRWHERAFVLMPLHELAPNLVTPAMLRATAAQRCTRVADPQWVA